MTNTAITGNFLVVEDNPDIWVMLKFILPTVLPHVPVIYKASTLEAMDYLANQSEQQTLPRLILQDFYLPTRADGIDFLRNLKQANSPYRHIPLVVMSSSTDPADKEELLRLGADTYLIKPIAPTEWTTGLRGLQHHWLESF